MYYLNKSKSMWLINRNLLNMKIKYLCSFLVFVSLVANGFGQTTEFRYAKSGSEAQILKVLVDSIGNNYILGSYQENFTYQDVTITGSAGSEGDIFMLKTSPSGEPIYLKSFKGSNSGDYITAQTFTINQQGEVALFIETDDVNQLLIGDYTLDLDGTRTNNVIVKVSKTGFLAWVKVLFTDDSSNSIYAKDLVLDEEGNVFVAGDFEANAAIFDEQSVDGIVSSSMIFVVKYESDGDVSWASSCVHQEIGDTGDIFASEIEVSTDGTIYISGTHTGDRIYEFSSSKLECKGITNAYVASFDPSGNALWALPFEGTNYIYPEMLTTSISGTVGFVCFYKSDDLSVDGTTYTSTTDFDLVLTHIDSDGTYIWNSGLATNLPSVYLGSDNAYIGFSEEDALYIVGDYFDVVNNVYSIGYEGVSGILSNTVLTSGGAYLGNTVIDRYGNTLISGNTYSDFDVGEYTVENTSGYGTSYFLKILSDGTVDYVYQQENSITEGVNMNHVGADSYNNSFVFGSYYGSSAQLDKFVLSNKYSNGIYTAEYSRLGSIAGNIVDYYNEPVEGQMNLLVYTNNQKSPLADSVVVLEDGGFEFIDVALGKYILQFEPLNTSDTDFLSTYFPSLGMWEDAVHIVVDKDNLSFSNLYVIVPEQPDFNGDAVLSGEITTVEEEDVFKSVLKKPRAKSKATLAKSKPKSDYQIIAISYSDDDGMFYFNNVDDGSYWVFVDIPGIPSTQAHLVNVAGGNYVSNIDYYVDEDAIYTVGSPSGIQFLELEENSGLLAYPNPSNGEFNLQLQDGGVMESVHVSDLQGKIVKQYIGINQKLLVDGLTPGIYIVNVSTHDATYNFKLIVNR